MSTTTPTPTLAELVDRLERAEARAEDAEQDTKDIGESLRRAHATLAGACETCDADGLMYVTVGVHPWGEEVEEATTCAECNGTGKGWIAELKARAEAAERRVAELEGRLEDRWNAWHDRDLRSGAETERAAIVADLREQARIFVVVDKAASRVIDLMAERVEWSGAHLGSKEGGADE